MPEQRIKFALRMSPELQKLVVDLYPRDNCQSQNEFIEKSIRFYAGYISSQDATEFLSRTLLSVMKGSVQDSEHRIRRILFKLATETALTTRIIATYEGIEGLPLSRLRGDVVQELKRTNGELRLEDAVQDRDEYIRLAEGDR